MKEITPLKPPLVKRYSLPAFLMLLSLWIMPILGFANVTSDLLNLNMTDTWLGYLAVGIFVLAYLLVMGEEFIQLRKSKPVLLAAGLIWVLVAIASQTKGLPDAANVAVRQSLVDYIEVFLFILVAMTYVNAMEDHQVFVALRSWLVSKNLSYHTLFWITGILSFLLSPVVDNLTAALIMCSIVMSVGANEPKFVTPACINIVVGANAGGAFSPFGDITTLMVWQKGVLPFEGFFHIFIPAVINFLIPAICMHFSLPNTKPMPAIERVKMAIGGKTIIVLFAATIATAIVFQHFFHLPATVGMMTGLAYLQFYHFYLQRKYPAHKQLAIDCKVDTDARPLPPASGRFEFFAKIQRVEWDTILFFYGIMLCVGGLASFGYLQGLSAILYSQWSQLFSLEHAQTPANITIGLLSAVIDNIPMMYAVLTMDPSMSEGQWLLATLTTGVGGSILAIGSAAGIALLGQAKGQYTFMSHLRWSWAILLGYVGSVAAHLWLNKSLF